MLWSSRHDYDIGVVNSQAWLPMWLSYFQSFDPYLFALRTQSKNEKYFPLAYLVIFLILLYFVFAFFFSFKLFHISVHPIVKLSFDFNLIPFHFGFCFSVFDTCNFVPSLSSSLPLLFLKIAGFHLLQLCIQFENIIFGLFKLHNINFFSWDLAQLVRSGCRCFTCLSLCNRGTFKLACIENRKPFDSL